MASDPDTADPREAARYEHGNWCVQTIRPTEHADTDSTFLHNTRCRDIREQVYAATEPSAGVTSEAGDLAEAIGRAAGIDPAMVDVDEAARRLSRGWDERRAALADRWPGPDPMTRFEMFGAVNRDAAWGLREFAPESGVIPDDLSAAAYDRRGLLNVVASLLDRLAATPSTSTETPTPDDRVANFRAAICPDCTPTIVEVRHRDDCPWRDPESETPTRVVGGGDDEALCHQHGGWHHHGGFQHVVAYAPFETSDEHRRRVPRHPDADHSHAATTPSVSDEGLRAALDKYGRHLNTCASNGTAVGSTWKPKDCNCGLDRALSSEPAAALSTSPATTGDSE